MKAALHTVPSESTIARGDGTRNALVFGATGFFGRWLVKELLDQGISTTAAVRNLARFGAVAEWLRDHNVATTALSVVEVDLVVDGIELRPGRLNHIREIFNVAGAHACGMTPAAARAANVLASRGGVAATLPHLGRLVHLSGYRVGGQDRHRFPGWRPNASTSKPASAPMRYPGGE
ncbi:NAD-dependent epimerase/dehydratase family protein [Cryobacterium mannosilyticum]|nr:NAD-dependent epimerase/dehydratase family protein [Cryobacterium mannosilyticum]